jgi:hypothetical protein
LPPQGLQFDPQSGQMRGSLATRGILRHGSGFESFGATQENCKVTFSRRVSRIRGIVILSEAKDLDGMQGFAPSYEILRCAQQ